MTGIFKTVFALALLLVPAGWTRAGSCDECEIQQALRIVSSALELRSDQSEGLAALLVERQLVIGPLAQEIQGLQTRLRHLLDTGANPTLVGQTVIEIEQRQRAMGGAQADFLERFSVLLDEDQRERFQQFHRAAEFSSVLPAFQRIHLL